MVGEVGVKPTKPEATDFGFEYELRPHFSRNAVLTNKLIRHSPLHFSIWNSPIKTRLSVVPTSYLLCDLVISVLLVYSKLPEGLITAI